MKAENVGTVKGIREKYVEKRVKQETKQREIKEQERIRKSVHYKQQG